MAGPADLTAVVDGDIQGLRRELEAGRRVMERFERDTATRLDRVNKAFSEVSNAIAKVRGAFSTLRTITISAAPIVALNQLSKAATNAIRDLRELGDVAAGLSVSTDFLQSLQLLGENRGLSSNTVTNAIREFGNALGDLRNKTGALQESLAGVDDALLRQLSTVTTVEEGFRVAADAIARLGNPLQRAQLAAKLFGQENQYLARALRDGGAALAQFQAEAIRSGQILDSSAIAKAREMELEFSSLSRALDNQFKEILIELGPVLIGFGEIVKEIAAAVRSFADSFRPLESLGLERLKERAADLRSELAAVNAEIAKLNSQQGWSITLGYDLAALEERARALAGQLAEVNGLIDRKSTDAEAERPGIPVRLAPNSGGGGADPREAGLRALASLQKEYLRATKQTGELIAFEYQEELKRFQDLLAKKAISNAEFEEARQTLASITSARLAEAAVKEFEPVANAIRSNLERAFSDFVETGKLDFRELTRSMLADLAKVAFRMAVIQPLFGGGNVAQPGGLLGGLLAGPEPGRGLLSGIFHEGGVVGEPGPQRLVPPAVFAGARRYHTGGMAGLMPGEVPAILEQGETVLPRGARPGGNNITFNINTPDADSFRRSEGQIAAMITRATRRGERNL